MLHSAAGALLETIVVLLKDHGAPPKEARDAAVAVIAGLCTDVDLLVAIVDGASASRRPELDGSAPLE